MLKNISDNMRKILIEELCKRYDNTNKKLQAPFLKMHYEKYEIEDMKNELKRIEEILEELRKED